MIQYIGFERGLLPANDGDGLTDDIFQLNVRCYTDSNVGLIKLTEDTSCEPSSTDKLDFTSVNIFPNPSNNLLNIEGLEELKISQVKIVNSNGHIIE